MSTLVSACRFFLGVESLPITQQSLAALRGFVCNFELSDIEVTPDAIRDICRSRGDDITPMVLNIETACRYSIDLWIYPKGACLPIHDHPGQASLIKCAYGSIKTCIFSRIDPPEKIYDQEAFSSDPILVGNCQSPNEDETAPQPLSEVECIGRRPNILRIGQKVKATLDFEGIVNSEDLAADTSFLSLPCSGNLHCFEAETDCAMLSVMTPSRGSIFPRKYLIAKNNPLSPYVVLEMNPRFDDILIPLDRHGDLLIVKDEDCLRPIRTHSRRRRGGINRGRQRRDSEEEGSGNESSSSTGDSICSSASTKSSKSSTCSKIDNVAENEKDEDKEEENP